MAAGQMRANHLAVIRRETGVGRKYLIDQVKSVAKQISNFGMLYSGVLPAGAISAITSLNDKLPPDRYKDASLDSAGDILWSDLVILCAFEAEMSYLLADPEARVRLLTERAIIHLRRLISADPSVAAKWQEAFEAGEVACEKLGAIHLLWHGIYSFKANAPHGRTDLLLQETFGGIDREAQFAEGSILTEWKIARNMVEAAKRYKEAQIQLAQYSDGLLAGQTLASCRYAIVISQKWCNPPEDAMENGITYRNVNIPVAPDVPSRTRVTEQNNL